MIFSIGMHQAVAGGLSTEIPLLRRRETLYLLDAHIFVSGKYASGISAMDKKTSEALVQFEMQRAERIRGGLAVTDYDFGLAARPQKDRKDRGAAYDPTLPSEGTYVKPRSGKKTMGAKTAPQPLKAKLTRREKKRRKAKKVENRLREEMRKGLLSTPLATSTDRKFSTSNAFSNIFTSTDVYQGGSPGGGKRR